MNIKSKDVRLGTDDTKLFLNLLREMYLRIMCNLNSSVRGGVSHSNTSFWTQQILKSAMFIFWTQAI